MHYFSTFIKYNTSKSTQDHCYRGHHQACDAAGSLRFPFLKTAGNGEGEIREVTASLAAAIAKEISVLVLSEVARTVFTCDWLWQDFGKTSCHPLHQKEEFSCC